MQAENRDHLSISNRRNLVQGIGDMDVFLLYWGANGWWGNMEISSSRKWLHTLKLEGHRDRLGWKHRERQLCPEWYPGFSPTPTLQFSLEHCCYDVTSSSSVILSTMAVTLEGGTWLWSSMFCPLCCQSTLYSPPLSHVHPHSWLMSFSPLVSVPTSLEPCSHYQCSPKA